ncbi:MAG: hypothetical protein K2J26_05780 [Ruminococcus sp.]|nr:hypothetical protein [Ruminococcus sp.]
MYSFSPESAVKYYIGDVSGNDKFFGDKKSYVTVNSLFFPDIYSETARASEGKYLNPTIISDIPRLMDFFEMLFRAFAESHCKCSETYRVERYSDFEICQSKGCTVSVTSTSYAQFLDSYRDRHGIALMRFIVPEDSPFINVAEFLRFYAKPEEMELMIPPFVSLNIHEKPLTEQELRITDSNGVPPEISCISKTGDIIRCGIIPESLPVDGEKAGRRVYDSLNNRNVPSEKDVILYTQWKSVLQKNLHMMFCEIFSLFH